MIHGIQVKVTWSMGHRLSHGYEGPCSNLHGHNYLATFEFDSDKLDEVGFVQDFKRIKLGIKDYIDRQLDHIMLISNQDPFYDVLMGLKLGVVAMDKNPTAENIAHLLFDKFSKADGWPKLMCVTVEETDSFSASYDRYGE